MGLKETISKITKKDEQFNSLLNDILLDNKINIFLDWFYKNIIKGENSQCLESLDIKKMKNTIEKMAVWYEFIYPELEIDNIYNSNSSKINNVNSLILKDSKYINEQNDDNFFNWRDIFNYNVFCKLLSNDEKRWITSRNLYPSVVFINISKSLHNPHFHLDSLGYIIRADDVDLLKNKDGLPFCSDDFQSKHLKEALMILKDNNVIFSKEEKEIEDIISYHDNIEKLKEDFLDCVMYHIIERGGNRIGPRRGLLYALEFHRNIDIPMKYGVDLNDSHLDSFIDKYIAAGGKSDLECIDSYFSKVKVDNEINYINLQDIKNIKVKKLLK